MRECVACMTRKGSARSSCRKHLTQEFKTGLSVVVFAFPEIFALPGLLVENRGSVYMQGALLLRSVPARFSGRSLHAASETCTSALMWGIQDLILLFNVLLSMHCGRFHARCLVGFVESISGAARNILAAFNK